MHHKTYAMKNILSIFFCLSVVVPTIAFTQNNSFQNIFVWPFHIDSGNESETTRQMTLSVEEILANNNYSVLKNSSYPELSQLVEPVGKIFTFEDIPKPLIEKLFSINAENLLIGKLKMQNGGAGTLYLSVFNLSTGQQVERLSVFLSDIELKNIHYRDSKVRSALLNVLNEKSTPAEDLLWQEINKAPKERKIRQYQSQYPGGRYITDIELRVWSECAASRKKKKCQQYIRLFPEGSHVADANKLIDKTFVDAEVDYGPDPELKYPTLNGSPRQAAVAKKKGNKQNDKPVRKPAKAKLDKKEPAKKKTDKKETGKKSPAQKTPAAKSSTSKPPANKAETPARKKTDNATKPKKNK